MNRVFYLAVFHKEDGKYWVSFPDFPECFSQGDSIKDSFVHAQEALELCIEERLANKEKLPNPTLTYDINQDENLVLLSCELDSNLVAA